MQEHKTEKKSEKVEVQLNSENLVEIKNLIIHYETKDNVFEAVNNIDLDIKRGKVLGLVGETGAGKTTIALSLMGLLPFPPTHIISGEIYFEGENLLEKSEKELRNIRGNKIGMIFQDPFASLDSRMTVFQLIKEPIISLTDIKSNADVTKRVYDLMELVGLARRLENSYPHELDGGRRQRIGIARALSADPEFIVCDEPVSALDVSIQAQVLNLLQDLRDEKKLTYMFITHDMSVVKHISDHIAVMYLGQVVEKCEAKELFKKTLHPYSQALLSAIPVPSLHNRREKIILKGELSSPINPKPGCRFAARCRYATDECRQNTPELKEFSPGHFVACHYAGKVGSVASE